MYLSKPSEFSDGLSFYRNAIDFLRSALYNVYMEEKSFKTEFLQAWEKLTPILRVVALWLKRLVWIFPPVIVGIAMLVLFETNGLYPFGSKTIAWCDMDQQVIPLLLQFKDILEGKEGFFFSFKNAGGL